MVGKKIIVAGHICLEVTPDLSFVPEGSFTSFSQPGKMIHTGAVRLATGGSVPNTGLALHKLGVPVSLIGKIGDDAFGRVIQDILSQESHHLVQDLVVDPSTPSGLTIIISPPGFDPIFFHSHGANDTFYASDLPRVILESADAFHFSTPPLMRSIYRGEGAELVSILLRARRAGLTTSLGFSLPDPASPAGKVDWQLILANSLPLVDLFFPSVAELLFLFKRETYDRMYEDAGISLLDAVTPDLLHELSEIVLGYGVKAVMINLGHRGNYLRTNGPAVWQKGGRGLVGLEDNWFSRELWAPAFDVAVGKTTGASDAAIGGFLSSILKGADPQTALIMASASGVCCVEGHGAIGGLRSWEAILDRVNQGWDQIPLNPGAAGWQKEGQYGLWVKA